MTVRPSPTNTSFCCRGRPATSLMRMRSRSRSRRRAGNGISVVAAREASTVSFPATRASTEATTEKGCVGRSSGTSGTSGISARTATGWTGISPCFRRSWSSRVSLRDRRRAASSSIRSSAAARPALSPSGSVAVSSASTSIQTTAGWRSSGSTPFQIHESERTMQPLCMTRTPKMPNLREDIPTQIQSMIISWCISADLDLTVTLFIFLDAVTDQDEDLAVGGTPLVVGNDVELVEHLLLDANG